VIRRGTTTEILEYMIRNSETGHNKQETCKDAVIEAVEKELQAFKGLN
jgi:hypothetical protein